MYPLSSTVTAAYEKSDALVVEADVLNQDTFELAKLVQEKGIYTNGSTLKDNLKADTWHALGNAARRYNATPELFQMQKPWLASLTLTALAMLHHGYSEQLGVDYYFLEQAKNSKPILELESAEMQLNLFDSMSNAEQVLLLEQTLLELKQSESYFGQILGAWREGDVAKLDKLINMNTGESKLERKLHDLVFLDRNYKMSDKLKVMLEKRKIYFVVVGAGHMVGEEGIPSLLSKAGYKVKQL